MSKFNSAFKSVFNESFNEYFYAWGDLDPNKKVPKNGGYTTVGKMLEYDDNRYYKPRRDAAGMVIILGGLDLIGLTGYGVCRGVSYLIEKYDERKKDEEKL